VEYEDRSLLDGEPSEGSFELVAVVDGQVRVGPVHGLDREEPDAFRPASATPGLGVAGVGQDPVQPRLEAVGVPQSTNLAPGGQQRSLDGVVGMVEVAQDSERDRHAPVAGHAGEGVEGLSIAPLRLSDQVCVHPSLRADVSRRVRSGRDRTTESGGSLSVQSWLGFA